MKNLEKYVEDAAKLIDLPIDPEYRPGVIANLEQIAAIAQLVGEFQLTDEIEISPIFQPEFNHSDVD